MSTSDQPDRDVADDEPDEAPAPDPQPPLEPDDDDADEPAGTRIVVDVEPVDTAPAADDEPF